MLGLGMCTDVAKKNDVDFLQFALFNVVPATLQALFVLLGLNPDMESIQAWIGLIPTLHTNPINPR
jgi:hypothetical protein